MAITTYHRQTDAEHIKALLEENGYHTSFSPGFMRFVYDELKPPAFRRGLIKASKKRLRKSKESCRFNALLCNQS